MGQANERLDVSAAQKVLHDPSLTQFQKSCLMSYFTQSLWTKNQARRRKIRHRNRLLVRPRHRRPEAPLQLPLIRNLRREWLTPVEYLER